MAHFANGFPGIRNHMLRSDHASNAIVGETYCHAINLQPNAHCVESDSALTLSEEQGSQFREIDIQADIDLLIKNAYIKGDEIPILVRKYNITSWVRRKCDICQRDLRYGFHDGMAFYNPSCDCNTLALPELRSYAEVAQVFNMQIGEEKKRQLLGSFLRSGK
jgi:hypothetical protein